MIDSINDKYIIERPYLAGEKKNNNKKIILREISGHSCSRKFRVYLLQKGCWQTKKGNNREKRDGGEKKGPHNVYSRAEGPCWSKLSVGC